MDSQAVTAGYRIIWKPMVFLRQYGKGCKGTMKEWEGGDPWPRFMPQNFVHLKEVFLMNNTEIFLLE